MPDTGWETTKHHGTNFIRQSLVNANFYTFSFLKSFTYCFFLKPDKGRGVVVLDLADYDQGILKIMNDPTRFKVVLIFLFLLGMLEFNLFGIPYVSNFCLLFADVIFFM